MSAPKASGKTFLATDLALRVMAGGARIGETERQDGIQPTGGQCRHPGCGHECTIGEQVLSDCLERVGKVRGGPYCPAHLRQNSGQWAVGSGQRDTGADAAALTVPELPTAHCSLPTESEE